MLIRRPAMRAAFENRKGMSNYSEELSDHAREEFHRRALSGITNDKITRPADDEAIRQIVSALIPLQEITAGLQEIALAFREQHEVNASIKAERETSIEMMRRRDVREAELHELRMAELRKELEYRQRVRDAWDAPAPRPNVTSGGAPDTGTISLGPVQSPTE